MEIDLSQVSELGDFKLIPDKGKKLSSFIDYESKLLIVTEYPIDNIDIPIEHGMRTIPSIKYVVDPHKKKILNASEWRKYFNYNKTEIISSDGKLKEEVQRVHKPDRNTDSLEHRLFDVEKSEPIGEMGYSVAFNDTARQSFIDVHYRSIERGKKHLKALELSEYPEIQYEKHLRELNEGDIVIQYFDDKEVFELKFEHGKFNLKNSSKPTNSYDWDNNDSMTIESFSKLDEFWNHLTTKISKLVSIFNRQKPWFIEYNLRIKSHVIDKFIIKEHNQIVQSRLVPYAEYKRLQGWINTSTNKDLERSVFWQFCSNCRDRVYYNPRYPNHACRKCVKSIIDSEGNKLDYRDTHELEYVNGKEKILLKDTKKEVSIFLKGQEYHASEARFGGIVHQLKE